MTLTLEEMTDNFLRPTPKRLTEFNHFVELAETGQLCTPVSIIDLRFKTIQTLIKALDLTQQCIDFRAYADGSFNQPRSNTGIYIAILTPSDESLYPKPCQGRCAYRTVKGFVIEGFPGCEGPEVDRVQAYQLVWFAVPSYRHVDACC